MNYNNYETSYTSYGGGGGSGGGFIPGEGSQSSPSGGRRDFTDSLRPVTIKQIWDAQSTGDEFRIDGATISQLTFVGQIRNLSSQTTNITYKIDDGTGVIEVKQWIDSDEAAQESNDPASKKARLVEDAYVRVWGKLKSFHDKKHVGAQIIRPVDDYNEINYHLLEATAVHLYYTKGPLEGTGARKNAGQALEQQTGAPIYGGENALQGYSAVAKKVYKYLTEAPQSNEGLHQQDIAANTGINTSDVAKAGDELLSGGLIYTTVDDQTWAVLETE
ncbi:replication protein A, subunit RPA32 [Sporormia fimetaria CBS 119925]|uniref:Replication protein A, subunit RPA32 n=1 Tax=Sporormia fimetaria CBS 119925 TaxID=1340428 RepID=A0A6A6V1C7_9PLEO|nr:replication protein A, subunit RPA32 [Sporormia fimetaria CBS 119925]